MILTIIGKLAARKKESSLEYELKNYIFIGSSAYSMEIELPLADYPQNLDIFGIIISSYAYKVSYRIIINHIVPNYGFHSGDGMIIVILPHR